MTLSTSRLTRFGAALCMTLGTGLVMAACSSSTDNETSLSQSDADAIGAAASAEVNTSAMVLTTGNAAMAGGSIGAGTAVTWSTTGCGTAAPFPVTDGDADGVPDSVRVTYATPACSYTNARGFTKIEVTGSVDFVDPTPSSADRSFKTRLNTLQYAFTRLGTVSSETRSGTRTVVANSSGLSQSNDLTVAYVKNGTAAGTLNNTLSASFTPATGSTIAMGSPLPNGTISLNGTLAWSLGLNTDSYTVTTITPLAYDALCAATSASPFKSGELRVRVTTPSRKGYVRLIYDNCTAPQVLLVTN